MSLSRIQENLQHIYELELSHNVHDFLITSREMARALDAGGSSHEAREQLLGLEDEDGLNLSLYLDKEIVSLFDALQHPQELDEQNLEEFCLALEGISHFVYLAWNATHDRPVTLLEMELQAEVDKFILLSKWFAGNARQPVPGQLRRLLFKSVSYHDGLGHEELKRYHDANRYAHEYCRRLESQFFNNRGQAPLLNELRRFYRLSKRAKLDRIKRI
jgi:hypothetical protein